MTENTEIWKDISGYEGRYQISDHGRVKSIRFGHEKLLKTYKTIDGYLQVEIGWKDTFKRCYVHRLVAEAFIPNPDNKPCVNHLNEVKQDNRAENLEWCTHKENSNWGTCQKRIAEWRSIPENKEKMMRNLVHDNKHHWYRKFKGKSPEEIEKIISGSGLSGQTKYNLRERFIRHPSKMFLSKPKVRTTKNWKRLFNGKTKEEIEEIINGLKISNDRKSALRRKYVRGGRKLTEEELKEVRERCANLAKELYAKR